MDRYSQIQDVDHYGADALAAWGSTAQLRMVQEECGELIAEINRFERGRASIDALCEEAADVLITLSCLRAFAPDEFDAALKRKLARARCRLDDWLGEAAYTKDGDDCDDGTSP